MMTMKTPTSRLLMLLASLLAACLLGGCVTSRGAPQTVFDLGIAAPPQNAALPALIVADPNVPPWLDSFEMFYRLNYANDHQLRPYTNSRWSMPPAQLFTQRLRSSIAAAGGTVLSPTENASNVPLTLRLDADDFSQIFDSADRSAGVITIRASLFAQRELIAQKTFSIRAEAPSSDAGGGARALASASDMLIADLLQWLSAASAKK